MVLLPTREKSNEVAVLEKKNNFLIVTKDQFLMDAKENGEILTLVVKGRTEEVVPEFSPHVQQLLEEFSDITPNELPTGLPPCETYNTALTWYQALVSPTCHITE